MAKAKLNIKLLNRLKTRFMRMRHSDHFDMGSIATRTQCGTAMCIAGHILDLQGYRFRFGDYGWIDKVIKPNGRILKGSELHAAAKETGMPYTEWPDGQVDAYDLFHDFALVTPKQAAARIQELIDSAE